MTEAEACTATIEQAALLLGLHARLVRQRDARLTDHSLGSPTLAQGQLIGMEAALTALGIPFAPMALEAHRKAA